MATLASLAEAGALVRHEADLEPDEQPQRYVSFAPDFSDWVGTTLRGMKRDRGRDLSPFEQLEQRFYDFVIGRPLAYDVHYKKLIPLFAHVWEIKTWDVRVYGWFAGRGHFVAVCGAMKNEVRAARDYAPLVARVLAFRESLELDEPKAVTGVRSSEVL